VGFPVPITVRGHPCWAAGWKTLDQRSELRQRANWSPIESSSSRGTSPNATVSAPKELG